MNKIYSLDNLIAICSNWKNKNKTIVFTNGCFDILHKGHIDYLYKASALGDKLVVAINDDESVRKNKGNYRPIINEKSRSIVLAALECVDAVVLFNNYTPEILIRKLCPDILVKGADYNEKNIVGANFIRENGGKVKTIALTKGYSTTEIIKNAKNSINGKN